MQDAYFTHYNLGHSFLSVDMFLNNSVTHYFGIYQPTLLIPLEVMVSHPFTK